MTVLRKEAEVCGAMGSRWGNLKIQATQHSETASQAAAPTEHPQGAGPAPGFSTTSCSRIQDPTFSNMLGLKSRARAHPIMETMASIPI